MRRLWLLLLCLFGLLLAGCNVLPVPAEAPTPTTFAEANAAPTVTPQVTATRAISSTGTPDAVAPDPQPTGEGALPDAQATAEGRALPDPAVERIIFLASDGMTIKSIKPDGSDEQVIFNVPLEEGEEVDNLTVDPRGRYILYSVTKEPSDLASTYYIIDGGAAKESFSALRAPRWSPNGTLLAAQTAAEDGAPGRILLQRAVSGERTLLDIEGAPDWFPDGRRLIYVHEDDVYSYDLSAEKSAKLTDLPHDTEKDSWVVQEAHVLPDGERIIFFGGPFVKDGEQQLGASGNGQQWWWIPSAGGTPQPWTEPGGNYIPAYASGSTTTRIAYVDSAHGNACYSYQTVVVQDSGRENPKPAFPQMPGFDESKEEYTYVRGLALSPRGEQVVFGVEPFRCPVSGTEPLVSPPSLYIWDVPPDAEGEGTVAPRKVADGSLPVWVQR